MYKPQVGRNTRLTTEEVKEYIESFGYSLIGEYINSKTKILVSCPNTNHEPYYVKFSNFVNGKRCPKCKFEKLSEYYRRDNDYVKNVIESHGLQWISGEYINSNSKLTVKCKNGHIYQTSFTVINAGYGCPHCYGNAKLTYDYVKSYIEERGHKLLSTEYINSSTPLNLMCPNGHEYMISWNKFKLGRRCPVCNQSNGIQIITNILNEYGIYYELEYRFCDDLVNNYLFDILIPNFNTVVEYDGEHHYKVNCFGGDLLELMNIKYRDKIKDYFCKINGINMIRIPYWEINNIEEVLLIGLNLY